MVPQAFAVDAVTALLGSSGLKAECVAAISDAVLEMAQYLLKNVAEYDWSCDKVGFSNTFIAIPCHIFCFMEASIIIIYCTLMCTPLVPQFTKLYK